MDDPIDRAFETELAELPQPHMSSEARERIGSALRRAEAARGPWWRRPVPRWRLIAACVLTGIAGFAVARFTAPEPAPRSMVPPRMMTVHQPLFNKRVPAVPRPLDINRWRPAGATVGGST